MIADVETAVARSTVRRALVVGPALVGVFAVAGGFDAAVASLIGVVIVVGHILLSGAMLSVAARISSALYHAAALLGFFLRMGLIALTMLIVARATDVDRFALGITVVVAYLTLFGWEAVAMTRAPEKERETEWT